MSEELLIQSLIKKYPNLFMDDQGKSLMFWPWIECGEGWYVLLDQLCKKLYKYKGLTFLQVKEKFGGLRVYWSYDTEAEIFLHKGMELIKTRVLGKSSRSCKIAQLVDKAEEESQTICEVCGGQGKLVSSEFNWIKTLCPYHQKKLDFLLDVKKTSGGC